ncbi:PREDICTED: receptor like protein 30-like [Ipomoea nil]|uniref:receptor like protein 30-like n=1 Tax=Ipomoea nil TaxID=35883 RepID=UPI0009010028|nr:PREDICTED: receptor like protein 30-like [Ipomoea nil]
MNHFYGNIPEEALKGDVLQILILHYNEFEGPLPRTLLNCIALQVLDVGNNGLNDSFPHWLDALPQLAVLILSCNNFYGVIGNPTTKIPFPMLRVLDLSNNHFTGHLPENYLLHFTGIINDITPHLVVTYSNDHLYYAFGSSVMLVVKGSEHPVEEILYLYTLIDLSSNMFDGDIPNSIGILADGGNSIATIKAWISGSTEPLL